MSPDDAKSLGPLMNLVGVVLLLVAQVGALRDRDRRERATGERPQPYRLTPRGRVLIIAAAPFIAAGATLVVVGMVAG